MITRFTSTKALLICGTIAGPLFIIAVLFEGAVRPGYNSCLYPLSSLSIGHQGWMQVANFIITGILLLYFSIGLKRVFHHAGITFRGPLLIALAGIGLTGSGIFVTDPLFGYPAGLPLVLRQFTLHGHLHDAFSMLVFICLPWACFVFQKRFTTTGRRGWAVYSAFTAYAMISLFIIASMGFKQLPVLVNVAGVSQRLCIATGLTWVTLLSLRMQDANVLSVVADKNNATA